MTSAQGELGFSVEGRQAPLAATRRRRLRALLKRFYRECGWVSRITAPVIGRILDFTMRREEKRLAEGWTYEPKPIVEKNEAAQALDKRAKARPRKLEHLVPWVTPELVPVPVPAKRRR